MKKGQTGFSCCQRKGPLLWGWWWEKQAQMMLGGPGSRQGAAISPSSSAPGGELSLPFAGLRPQVLEQRGGVAAGVRDVCQPSPTTPVPRNPCRGQAAQLVSSSLANFGVLAPITPRLDSTLPEGKLGLGLIHFFFSPITKIRIICHVPVTAMRFFYSCHNSAPTLPLMI